MRIIPNNIDKEIVINVIDIKSIDEDKFLEVMVILEKYSFHYDKKFKDKNKLYKLYIELLNL